MPPTPVSQVTDAASVLRRNRERANAFAEKAGKAPVRTLLERAQADLLARLDKAEGLKGPGKDSFTAAQLRSTLEQVRHVLAPLAQGMSSTIVQSGVTAANQETEQLVGYLNDSEKQYRGISQGLQINEAALFDKAISGTKSSILARIEGDPNDPRRPGVLGRYGASVIGDFEAELQMRFVAKTPWEDVKKAITAKSAFLQGAPAHWAERIVRTEVMNANNRAGLETVKAADEQLGDMCKILCATFDNRTGADSFAVHGQIRRPNEPFDSWFGAYMHPPNRPNDREVVVPHRVCWPIPPGLKPKGAGEIAARWRLEGRKGSPPAQPNLSTIDLARFGKEEPPPVKPPELGPEAAPPAPLQEAQEVAAAPAERAPRRRRALQEAPINGAPDAASDLDLPLPSGLAAPSGYEDDPRAVGGMLPVFPGVRTHMQALGVSSLYRLPLTKTGGVAFKPGVMAKMQAPPAMGPLRPYADVMRSIGKSLDALVKEHAEPIDVNDSALKEVIPTKRAVDRKVVASLIAVPPSPEDAEPVYVKHQGKIYLHSGHEQLMAANLGTAPKTERPSRLIDLDKLARPSAPTPEAFGKRVAATIKTDARQMGAKEQKEMRDSVRDLLHSQGIVTREDRYRRTPLGQLPTNDHGVGMDAYTMLPEPGYVSGLGGMHTWDGAIKLAPDAHANAVGMFRQMAAKTLPKSVAELNSVAAGLQTIIHEQIHGASKVEPLAYSGVGIGMEEAATEILARKVTRDMLEKATGTKGVYALPTLQPDGKYGGGVGAYPEYIDGLFNEVASHTGHDKIHERIEQALLRTRAWGKGERYANPEAAIADFANEVTQDPKQRMRLRIGLAYEHGPFRTPDE